MILTARYGVQLRSENLTGNDLNVDAFVDPFGTLETRTVKEGDLVLEVVLSDGTTSGALWVVHEGRRWTLAANQPAAGDLLVSVVPTTDLPYQAGSVAVFADDLSFAPANLGLIASL